MCVVSKVRVHVPNERRARVGVVANRVPRKTSNYTIASMFARETKSRRAYFPLAKHPPRLSGDKNIYS